MSDHQSVLKLNFIATIADGLVNYYNLYNIISLTKKLC